MPTTRAHRFCDTQPTTSLALLRIQLIILPMIPGRASAALIPNRPNRDAKALSLFLIHSFKPFSSLGGGSPPDVVAPPPPGNNALTSTVMAILIAVSMEAIIIPCSLNRFQIFSPNEVSLSKTLAIVSFSGELRQGSETSKSPQRSLNESYQNGALNINMSVQYSQELASCVCIQVKVFEGLLAHWKYNWKRMTRLAYILIGKVHFGYVIWVLRHFNERKT